MPRFEDGYVEFIQASKIRPLLRRELRDAYKAFAIAELGDGQRMIAHHPNSHASDTKLPWPLSKLMMHDVEITTFNAKGDIVESKRFSKHQIDQAIDEFLHGLPPELEVSLNVDFPK